MSRPALASPAPSWEELQSRWPNAGASRFVTVGGIAWHLHHAPAARDRHAANQALFARTRAQRAVRCPLGLDAHATNPAAWL